MSSRQRVSYHSFNDYLDYILGIAVNEEQDLASLHPAYNPPLSGLRAAGVETIDCRRNTETLTCHIRAAAEVSKCMR